jgi:pimeloyl-ACP methyl ester carboxylesterase
MRARFFASALTGWMVAAGSPAAGTPPVPCPKLPTALCGTLHVPEDRATPGSRVLDLDYVVFPARRQESAPPLFFLLGGPGEAAASIAPFVERSPFADLLDTRALVLLDQRGTAGSHRLQCPPPADPSGHFGRIFDPGDVAACRAGLSARADLRLYTTTIAVEDLDALRAALGYERIVVWGRSYGTRVAMEYLRRHGDHVERAVLDAVSGLDGFMPLYFAYDAQRAFDRVLADCASEPACAQAFPGLGRTLDAVLDRLREGPVRVAIRAGADAGPVEVPFSLGDLGYTIRGMLYDRQRTSRLPAMLDRAARTGDLAPFAQEYYRRSSTLGDDLANGMYLSVVCAEDVPFITGDAALRWTAGTFLGTYLVEEYRRACSLWARGEIPADYHAIVRSDAPVLILSGGRDPSTPPRWGEKAAGGLPNGRHVVFPAGGHGVGDTPCGGGIIRSFLAGTHPKRIDAACASSEAERTPFETTP